MPDVTARLLEFGVIPEGDSSADFAAYIENEISKWKRVIEIAKIDKI
jgi:tripartite-type tricarboxylate transporter receptor subunit TctC